MSEKNSLTPVERELMEILWQLGKGTVREVMVQLPAKRNLAYTSVSTILRILEQKKIVTTKKSGRQHIYIPKISKQVFASQSVDKMVKQIFAGDAIELVSYLVKKNNLSEQEITRIQTLLEVKKKELVS